MKRRKLNLNNESHLTHFFKVSSKRKLAYLRLGKEGGIPVYYFHGTPSSRLEAVVFSQHAEKYGYEIFAIERPGCGESDYINNYTNFNFVDDILKFSTEMNHEQFGLISFSGGSTYLNTCLYKIPEKIIFAYDLGGWGPVGENEELLKYLAPLDRFFIKKTSKSIFKFFFSFLGYSSKLLSDKLFIQSLKSSISKDDWEFLQDKDSAKFFRSIVRESFKNGIKGPADDAIRCYRYWGFNVKDINYPVNIWHGKDDKFADINLAIYKHERNNKSLFKKFKDRGHLHLLTISEDLFKNIG